MQLSNQSHEILNEPNQYKLIELAGRLCWKSENKIAPDSHIEFIKKLIKLKHFSVIEHGHAAFRVSYRTAKDIKNNLKFDNFLTNTIDDTYLTMSVSKQNTFIVSGNLRAWKEYLLIPNVLDSPGVKSIARWFNLKYPEIFPFINELPDNSHPINNEDLTDEERIIHTVRSVRIITDRGVSHELVRHRPMAISQESTRYVRYDDMKFVLPIGWIEYQYEIQKKFLFLCNYCEQKYIELLNLGWPPQYARQILPNCLKTELIITATLKQWYHMFNLRCSKGAHPQIRSLMQDILKDFISLEPEIFTQQSNLLKE